MAWGRMIPAGRSFMQLLCYTFLPALVWAQDSLPLSRIDIPIDISLKPVFALAEKGVDTVFTSPGYPQQWVQADCATRYKYRFRRSPLHMKMEGTALQLSFTGYYQIIGATRACAGSTVLSPWSPSCRCGFDEPERRVQVAFHSQFRLTNDLRLQTRIVRGAPKPLDKCTVCFWGQDVTAAVMQGLTAELDLTRKALEDSFGNINLRPYLQPVWDKLSATYPIPSIGYFSLHPKNLRMQNLSARNGLLHIDIGLTASPQISLAPMPVNGGPVPNLTPAPGGGGFQVHFEAALQYDSLSGQVQAALKGRRFEVADGLFKKHIIIEGASVAAADSGQLAIRIDFSGSFLGSATFNGRPYYNPETKSIEVKDLEYDLKTRNILLKTAKWLFSRRIKEQLNRYTHFELASYYDTATHTLNQWLNREWTPGISGSGAVTELSVTSLEVKPDYLLLRTHCRGVLRVQVNELHLAF